MTRPQTQAEPALPHAAPQATPPAVPTGIAKTFGPCGPKYVVGKPLRRLPDGDWMIEITLLGSTIWMEKTEYRLSHIHADPEEAR